MNVAEYLNRRCHHTEVQSPYLKVNWLEIIQELDMKVWDLFDSIRRQTKYGDIVQDHEHEVEKLVIDLVTRNNSQLLSTLRRGDCVLLRFDPSSGWALIFDGTRLLTSYEAYRQICVPEFPPEYFSNLPLEFLLRVRSNNVNISGYQDKVMANVKEWSINVKANGKPDFFRSVVSGFIHHGVPIYLIFYEESLMTTEEKLRSLSPSFLIRRWPSFKANGIHIEPPNENHALILFCTFDEVKYV